jgi:TPR repeat protein
MKLAEYFSKDRIEFLKPTPATGERSDWLDFCDLILKGSSILVVDAQFVPSESDGLLVKLSPGIYSVQAKVANYGGDQRVARLRVFQKGGNPKLAEKIGETWTDTAKTGICDFEIFSQAWGKDDDASYNVIEPFFDTEDEFGIATLNQAGNAVMPFVSSGFGDGSFTVFELQADGQRAGFEIEFIADGEEYSFDQTPYQRQNRVREIERRAVQGDVEAQFQLGKMYQAGKEIGKDLEKAVYWFEKAVQNGKVEAINTLALIYQNGKGVPQNYLRAKELFEMGVAKGDLAAINNLGILYRHGRGVPPDISKAVALYSEAANKGFAAAQFNLGVCYANGVGVEKNLQEAVKWYLSSADKGYAGAICNLGYCHKNGLGVDVDEKMAVKFFQIGALEHGHAMCANNLADCYETGCGVEKDLKKARHWYLEAAGKGVAIAQKSLGVLHKKGEGGRKNLELALDWLREASKNGNAEAHYELGLLYETGEGVTADKVEACKLYQKAVTGGLTKAEERLKELTAMLTDTERAAIAENSKK